MFEEKSQAHKYYRYKVEEIRSQNPVKKEAEVKIEPSSSVKHELIEDRGAEADNEEDPGIFIRSFCNKKKKVVVSSGKGFGPGIYM